MSEHTLHTTGAKGEHCSSKKGVMPEISELDNHAIHVDEHTRYALQYDFELYKKRNPQYAELLLPIFVNTNRQKGRSRLTTC